MKYTVEVKINLPRERVIQLLDNADNMTKWQEGLVSFEHIEGEEGQVGAKSRMKYIMGKREVEMIETITSRNFPDEFSGTYETKGVWNLVQNHFYEEGSTTVWKMDCEFRCSGWLKLMTWFAPGMFKKQTKKDMTSFKNFSESAS